MTEKHLRASILKIHADGFMKDFIVAFNPIEYVCYFEKKTEDNPHIHCYLKYINSGPSKQKLSEFMKKQPLIKNNKFIGGYYHKMQHKTKERNIVYTIKDGCEIMKNIDIDEYKIASEVINKDKELTSREKLYNRYIKRYGIIYPTSKYMIFEFIDDTYMFEFNKSPPNGSQLCMYSRYVIKMIHNNIELKNSNIYNLLMINIYGIKDHRELLHDINREEAIFENKRDLEDVYNCDFID